MHCFCTQDGVCRGVCWRRAPWSAVSPGWDGPPASQGTARATLLLLCNAQQRSGAAAGSALTGEGTGPAGMNTQTTQK